VFTSDRNASFTDFRDDDLIHYQAGIYFDSEKTKQEVEKFNQIRCPVPTCNDSTVYNTQDNLKKHLKEKHNRFFCDLCLTHRTLVFKEQKLYTAAQLERHLKKGDIDEEGNITFFHPFCKFCYDYVYDEELLHKHLTQNHFNCHLCGEDQKYFWYSKYENLEIHFNLSHYLCPDYECKQKCFIVFNTAAELENHNLKQHTNLPSGDKGKQAVNQALLTTLTNFTYGESERAKRKKEFKTILKDKEGVNFEPQFLSRRAMKTKFYEEKEAKPDDILDVRDYYQQFASKEFDLEPLGEMNKQSQNAVFLDDADNQGRYRSKKKAGNKEGKQSEMFVPKNQEEMYFEDCNMVHYYALVINPEEWERNLKSITSEYDFKNIRYTITDYFQGRIDEKVLFDGFVKMLGPKQAYKVFPFFIATVDRDETAKALDDVFYRMMSKLPKKTDSFIAYISTYGQLFTTLYKEIEIQILNRIQSGKFNIKAKNYNIDPARTFQLHKIVARLSSQDMAQFKFAKQFGLSSETFQQIQNMFIEDKKMVQDKLSKVTEEELLLLYKYVDLCEDRLFKRTPYLEIKTVPRNVLSKIFEKHPEIKKRFEKELNEEDFENLQKLGPISFVSKKSSADYTQAAAIKKTAGKKEDDKYSKEERKAETRNPDPSQANPDFDAGDRFEFPVLPKDKKNKKKETKTLNSQWIQSNANPFNYKEAPSIVKKKIESDFPTLVGDSKAKPIWDQQKDKDSEWSTSKLTPTGKVEDEDMGIFGKKEDGKKKLEKMVVGEKTNKKGEALLFLSGGFR
jgi:hypothetical protein